jgi:hypothetical protein
MSRLALSQMVNLEISMQADAGLLGEVQVDRGDMVQARSQACLCVSRQTLKLLKQYRRTL